MPLILVGSEYWKALEDFIVKNLLDIGTIDQADLNLYNITDSDDEVLEIIKQAPVRNGIRYSYKEDDAQQRATQK